MSPALALWAACLAAIVKADVSHLPHANPHEVNDAFKTGNPKDFWWMNDDNPFKDSYNAFKKCGDNCGGNFEIISTTKNNAGFNGGLKFDISSNPFLRGQVATAGQNCRGESVACVPRKHCVDGVASEAAKDAVPAGPQGKTCHGDNVCCLLAGQKIDLNLLDGKTVNPSKINDLIYTSGKSSVQGKVQIINDGTPASGPQLNLVGDASSSTAKPARDVSGAVFGSTVDYSNVRFADNVRESNKVPEPYLPPYCGSGEIRRPDGSCERPSCAPGQERGRDGLCRPKEVPTCPPGFIQLIDGGCGCPPGQQQTPNGCQTPTTRPTTPRPPPGCPPGLIRQVDGSCGCPPGQQQTPYGCQTPTTRPTTPRPPPGCPPGLVQQVDGGCGCPPGQQQTPYGCQTPTTRPPSPPTPYCPSGQIRLVDGSCGCPPGQQQTPYGCQTPTTRPTTPRTTPPPGCPPGLVRLVDGGCGCPPGQQQTPYGCQTPTTRPTTPRTTPPPGCPPGLVRLVDGGCGCPPGQQQTPYGCQTPTTRPPSPPTPYCPSGQIRLVDGSCGCPPGQQQTPYGCQTPTTRPTTPRTTPPPGCPPGLVRLVDGGCGCPPGQQQTPYGCQTPTTRPTTPRTTPPPGCPPGLVRLVDGGCGCPPGQQQTPYGCQTPTTRPPSPSTPYCPSGQIRLVDGSCGCPPGQQQTPYGCQTPTTTSPPTPTPYCPPGQERIGGECRRITCLPGQQRGPDGLCVHVPSCPPGLRPTATGCACPDGTSPSPSGRCGYIPPPPPPPITTPTPTCPPGQSRGRDGRCQPKIVCPPSQKLTPRGCICLDGNTPTEDGECPYIPPPPPKDEVPAASDDNHSDIRTQPPTTSTTPPNGPPPPPAPPQSGCAAALVCVQEIYCTADATISKVPVTLTKLQELTRVPTSECTLDTGSTGRCCRDPTYVDPWPSANLVDGVDDGQYKEDNLFGQRPGDFTNTNRVARSNKKRSSKDAEKVHSREKRASGTQTVCGQRNYKTSPPGPGPLDANFAEIPWQAMILRQSNRSLLCGGVIIEKNAVLTAAHCVEGLETSDVLIKGGEWKLGIDEEPLPFQIVKVSAIIRHPEYNRGSKIADLAVLALEENLRLTKNIGTLCLPEPNQIPTENCIATGWGKRILQLHARGAIMHKIGVNVMDNQQCQQMLGQYFQKSVANYSPNTLCGFSSIDQCKVDYGSALACANENGQYILSGIYSWDTGCKQQGQIGGYVAPDVEWIQYILAKPLQELRKLDREWRSLHSQ